MEDRDTREYWEWLDIEAADFRVYYTSYSTEEFKERWIKGLDRLFTKGYITLKTYLGLRMGKGKTNKVSNIVRLVARRIAWSSLNI